MLRHLCLLVVDTVILATCREVGFKQQSASKRFLKRAKKLADVLPDELDELRQELRTLIAEENIRMNSLN